MLENVPQNPRRIAHLRNGRVASVDANFFRMTKTEIEAICKQVEKDREAKDPPPLPHDFPLEFRNGRVLESPDDLVGLERQAVAFLRDGIGHEGQPEDIFSEEAQDEGLYRPELWDVHDPKGALAYRLWLFSDNGCVFRGDTIEVVGGISQGGLGIRDAEVGKELIAARKRVKKAQRPEDSVLDQFDLD